MIQPEEDEYRSGPGSNFDNGNAAFSSYERGNPMFDSPGRIVGSPNVQATSPGYQPSSSPVYIAGA